MKRLFTRLLEYDNIKYDPLAIKVLVLRFRFHVTYKENWRSEQHIVKSLFWSLFVVQTRVDFAARTCFIHDLKGEVVTALNPSMRPFP